MTWRKFWRLVFIVIIAVVIANVLLLLGTNLAPEQIAQIQFPYYTQVAPSAAAEENACDAFANGFTPKSPLFGSASVTSNNGSEVHVLFSSTGPTPLLPGILLDLRMAANITTSNAQKMCAKEEWEGKPCELEVTFEGLEINLGVIETVAPKIRLSAFGLLATAYGTVKYKCKCAEPPSPTPSPSPTGEPPPPPTPQ